jgi:hypothetical protein
MVACTRRGKHPENCVCHPADAAFSVYLPRQFRQSIFLGSDHFYILSPHSAQLLQYFLPIVRFNFGVAFLQLTYRRRCGPCLHRHRPARLVKTISGILGLHSARSGFISENQHHLTLCRRFPILRAASNHPRNGGQRRACRHQAQR